MTVSEFRQNVRHPYAWPDWPATFRVPTYAARKGKHNIAGTRYDVWFRFEGRN